MKISIIIPVYNRQELVKETLDSVLVQTYQNWECIVVDDGSTDNTWQVLQEYAAKDERIKIHKRHREPKGAPTCRNIGIELSEGKYLMFLDSDDLITEDCLAYRVKKSIENPKFTAWMFNTGIFYKKLGDTNILWNKLNTNNDDVIRFLNQDMPWHTSGPLWLNIDLLKFNEKAISFQDWEYHLNFLMQDKKYYKDPEDNVNAYYRNDEILQSISSETFTAKQLSNRIAILISTCQVISDKTDIYDQEIIKLIFKNLRLLKAKGLKKEAYNAWYQAKTYFNISKFESILLSAFLFLETKNNIRLLEFLIYKVFKKGHLLTFKSTFLSYTK